MRMTSGFALGLVATLSLGAHAAAIVDTPIKVDVPFSFVVDGKTLPAGAYVVEAAEGPDPALLILRSEDTKLEVIFLTEEAVQRAPTVDSEVVFDEVGGKYYLCRVLQAGSEEANALPRSPEERALEANRSPDHGHRSVKARS